MEFDLIEITSQSYVFAKGFPALITVMTDPFIEVKEDQIGFLEGKRTHHREGVFCQGGVINPGWSGHLAIELIVMGEVTIRPGDEIAHAIILEGKNKRGYTFRD